MTIILALCIPITAIVVGYFTLKGVQLGLRWKIQTEQQQLPTMDKPVLNPFGPKQPLNGDILNESVLQEWLNGPKPKEGE
jgi:hypothetical protein